MKDKWIPDSPPAYTGAATWEELKPPGAEHYKHFAIEPGHFAHANGLKAYATYAIKYICRHDVQGLPEGKGGRKDIEKAIDCLKLILELEYMKPDPMP